MTGFCRRSLPSVLFPLLAGLAGLGGLLPLVPRAARAQEDEAAAEDPSRDQARDLFRRGREQLQRGRASQALELFQQSHDLLPHWATSNGMALCQEQLGEPSAALRLYEQALAEGGMPDANRTEIQTHLDGLRRSLDLGRLEVSSTPPGARVLLDGAELGTAPLEADVAAGDHVLVLELDGYEPAERALQLGAGERRSADFALSPAQAVLPVGEGGRLAVASDPSGAEVQVDGTVAGTTPLERLPLAPGEHWVRVTSAAENRVWEERLLLSAGVETRIDVTFGGSGIDSGWFWGMTGTALAAAVGWVGAGSYAWSLHDEYAGASPERQDEIRPTAEASLDAADALLGVASGFALTALVLAFFTDFGGGAEADIGLTEFSPATAASPAPR